MTTSLSLHLVTSGCLSCFIFWSWYNVHTTTCSNIPSLIEIKKLLSSQFGIRRHPWPLPSTIHSPALNTRQSATLRRLFRYWFPIYRARRHVAWSQKSTQLLRTHNRLCTELVSLPTKSIFSLSKNSLGKNCFAKHSRDFAQEKRNIKMTHFSFLLLYEMCPSSRKSAPSYAAICKNSKATTRYWTWNEEKRKSKNAA